MALLTVGIGDCKISNDPADVLVTHALGSCIAVLLYDPVAKVAGLLHYMLPESALDIEKAGRRPFMFADTGIPLLMQSAFQLGATKSRSVIMAAGGAQMLDPDGTFNIGRRNHLAMKRAFWNAGLIVIKEDIGGTSSRTVKIDVAQGCVRIKTAGRAEMYLAVDSARIGIGDGFQHTHRP